MTRRPINPFYPLLGLAGFAFTITAASSCVAVLRGVKPESARPPRAAFDRLLDRHGTAILVGELVILAIATVGAVATDHAAGRRAAGRRSPPGADGS